MCRFPLLLHYLEQQENVEIPQWHNWLLDLLTGANHTVIFLILKHSQKFLFPFSLNGGSQDQ